MEGTGTSVHFVPKEVLEPAPRGWQWAAWAAWAAWLRYCSGRLSNGASSGQVFPTAVLEQERGILNECFPSGWPGNSQQLAWCLRAVWTACETQYFPTLGDTWLTAGLERTD